MNRNIVHLWRSHLEPTPDRISQCLPLLSADERQRADRFYFDRDRHRFILTRAGLRLILGHYLTCDPATVQFVYGDRGKPALAPPFAASRLHFNLSHSQAMALYAVTCDRQLGVDIEWIRDIPDVDRLAQKVLSEREYAEFQTFDATDKNRTFLTYWTCKEAYVKAVGAGLSLATNTVEVAIAPPPHLLRIAGDATAAAQWSLSLLPLATDYVAALVVEGHSCPLQYWDCSCLFHNLPV